MKYIKSDVIWIVLREVQSSFAETEVKDSLSVITSCPGWRNKYTWKMALSFPLPGCQHRSTRQVNTTQFIMGGLSRAELLQTTSEWIMGSHAKLRNKESTVQAAPSHLRRGSRAGSQARGSHLAIMKG